MTDQRDTSPVLLDEALSAIRSQLSGSRDREVVPLSQATDRVLAVNLIARVNLPHRDSSAVDGFAVRAADLIQGRGGLLAIAGEAAAGHPFRGRVEPGQAVRVFTGASIPEGADRVLMQEDCLVDGASMRARWQERGRTHIRLRGEDIHEGATAPPP